jgi:hypothetical protein
MDKSKYRQLLAAFDEQVSEALTTGQLALTSTGSDDNSEECAAVRRTIERLQRAGATSKEQDATKTLLKMRTFRIEKPLATRGSATFWVVVAGNGVKESNLIEGSLELSTLGLELNRLKMPEALPPGSRAHCSAREP